MKKKTTAVVSLFIFSIFLLTIIAVEIKKTEGEEISYLDGLYWVITTITTVGYGDIVMYSQTGKIFAMFVQIYGIAFLFGVAIPYVMIPWAERRFLLSIPEKVDISNHIVIFGYTKLTPHLISQIEKIGVGYVVIETERDKAINALKNNHNAILCKIESCRKNANADKAMSAVIMWDNVERALDALITLRDVDIPKIAVLSDPFYARYLHYAGVSKVITPKSVAGAQVAKIILEKISRDMEVKTVLGDYGMTELLIPEKSPVAGMNVQRVSKRYTIRILAVWREGRLIFMPENEFIIEKGDMVLAFGKRNDLIKFYDGVVT